ncbi:MAG: hypothetical protein WD028_00790 [Balneolaceae bacterium]
MFFLTYLQVLAMAEKSRVSLASVFTAILKKQVTVYEDVEC